jgi:hypothetical protein
VKVMDCAFLGFSILINTTAILQAFVILLYLMESSCFSLYLSISSVCLDLKLLSFIWVFYVFMQVVLKAFIFF